MDGSPLSDITCPLVPAVVSAHGSNIRNIVPLSGSLVRWMAPARLRTIPCTTASPSPRPADLVVKQILQAAAQGEFAPEVGTGLFHSGATRSWKQVQFGEANVQLTFHENNTKTINGMQCVMIEPDIDYYKDVAAHALLEVITNKLTNSLTDPRQVYVLRWIAGRHAGIPNFEPPYTID
jgi:hypothetical protein